MKASQANDVFKRAIGGAARKPRQTPAQKRLEIANTQIEALERVAAEIRSKARETPAWSKAYFSAVTAIEMEIQRIKC